MVEVEMFGFETAKREIAVTEGNGTVDWTLQLGGGPVRVGIAINDTSAGLLLANAIVLALLDQQLDDGGWNCESIRSGSRHGSFHTTISVLDALVVYERAEALRRARIIDRRTGTDRLLDVLPAFNSAWIRNLNHVCRFRQQSDEPGKATGDRVPGRCWRVHNLVSSTRGPYGPGEGPDPDSNDPPYSRSAGPDVRDALFGDQLSGVTP